MAARYASVTLAQRFAALTRRERLFLAAAAVAVLLFILWLIMRAGEEPGVELAEAPPPTSSSPPVVPMAPPPIAPVVPASPPAADPSALSGVVLRGVMGGGPAGGAGIFQLADGSQRVVRIGREIVPGAVLRAVGASHALASSGTGEVRLELGKAGAVALANSTKAPASAPSNAAGAQRATMQFRIGLQPVKSGGRVAGHAVKPGAQLPQLARAGLQPGDVIVAVNGSQFDEERLMELSWTLANSGGVDLEFLRNGKRMKASLGPSRQQ